VLEPVKDSAGLDELLGAIERHELVARFLDLETGKSRIEPGRWSDALEFDGRVLKTVHGPRWRLLLIGAAQLSRYVAQMAQALDYHVTVCDPREEYADAWDLPGVPLDRGYPDDVVLAMNLDAHSAVVAVTHDPKLDDVALLEALKSPAFYVGALGSKANNDKRRKRLADFDLSAEEISRLHGPVGLKIGSRTPPEIAVAILAEMTAVRRGVQIPQTVEPPRPGSKPGAAYRRIESGLPPRLADGGEHLRHSACRRGVDALRLGQAAASACRRGAGLRWRRSPICARRFLTSSP